MRFHKNSRIRVLTFAGNVQHGGLSHFSFVFGLGSYSSVRLMTARPLLLLLLIACLMAIVASSAAATASPESEPAGRRLLSFRRGSFGSSSSSHRRRLFDFGNAAKDAMKGASDTAKNVMKGASDTAKNMMKTGQSMMKNAWDATGGKFLPSLQALVGGGGGGEGGCTFHWNCADGYHCNANVFTAVKGTASCTKNHPPEKLASMAFNTFRTAFDCGIRPPSSMTALEFVQFNCCAFSQGECVDTCTDVSSNLLGIPSGIGQDCVSSVCGFLEGASKKEMAQGCVEGIVVENLPALTIGASFNATASEGAGIVIGAMAGCLLGAILFATCLVAVCGKGCSNANNNNQKGLLWLLLIAWVVMLGCGIGLSTRMPPTMNDRVAGIVCSTLAGMPVAAFLCGLCLSRPPPCGRGSTLGEALTNTDRKKRAVQAVGVLFFFAMVATAAALPTTDMVGTVVCGTISGTIGLIIIFWCVSVARKDGNCHTVTATFYALVLLFVSATAVGLAFWDPDGAKACGIVAGVMVGVALCVFVVVAGRKEGGIFHGLVEGESGGESGGSRSSAAVVDTTEAEERNASSTTASTRRKNRRRRRLTRKGGVCVAVSTLLVVVVALVIALVVYFTSDEYHASISFEEETNPAAFNAKFAASPNKIIRRVCSSCAPSHRVVYYRRCRDDGTSRRRLAAPSANNTTTASATTATATAVWDAWSAMRDWKKAHETGTNDMMAGDFSLFSTYREALEGKRPWMFCNYLDGEPFPSRCGPRGEADAAPPPLPPEGLGDGDALRFYVEKGGVPKGTVIGGPNRLCSAWVHRPWVRWEECTDSRCGFDAGECGAMQDSELTFGVAYQSEEQARDQCLQYRADECRGVDGLKLCKQKQCCRYPRPKLV